MRAEKWPLDAPIRKSLVLLTGIVSVSGVRTTLYLSKERCVRSENGCRDYPKLFSCEDEQRNGANGFSWKK